MAASGSNLLQLKKGVKTFGMRSLFEDASFAINEGERVGVIGPNGAGKSTLFKIITGQESLDSGELTRATGLRVGYLAQEDHWNQDITVEEVLTSQTATPLWDLKKFAPSFGLDPTETGHFPRKMMSLSGGYRMRVKLLHLLASRPDLMLLDEPTNYLDLETLLVLENFLLEAPGAFLLISHDREFLKRVTDHILEVEAGQMTKYAGNIDDYFEQKALLRAQLERAAQAAQNKRNEVLDFAARFGAKATKARQVQSRLKQLDKMESIEVRALPIKAKIRLPQPVQTVRAVVQIHEGVLGYGEKQILNSLNLDLNRGDHLGVVGVNGAGKSTLLKALSGELKPMRGSLNFGNGVEVAYFAQHVAERLKNDVTVLDAMGEFAHAAVSRQDVLDLAGSLLFSGDDVNKKIRVLSGGEKSRVALGQVLLKRASLLLLDEPTNHLDFDTVEALTQALEVYQGSIVVVSHDRGFVQRTASKILEIRQGRAEFYPGTYEEYVWSVQKGALSDRQFESPTSLSGAKEADDGATDTPKFNFKERKKQLEREIKTCEKEMATIDARNVILNSQLLALNERLLGPGDKGEIAREIGLAQSEIERLEERYLEFLSRHDEAERDLGLIENR